MITSILKIAKKEIMDNIRNKWIIIITLIFAILTIVVSYFGSYGKGWQDLNLTISGMSVLVQYLIPIIALMLGYAAIVGEVERGSMSSMIALPISRLEILLGKFLGLGGVLFTTILVGFGISGIVIGINVSDVNYVDYLVFIFASVLIGLVFLSVAMFFSCIFKRRSTAIGGAVFLWFFFAMILNIIMSGILFATIGLEKVMAGEIPDWYYGLSLINPLSAYSGLVTLNVVDLSSIQSQVNITYPSFYTTGLMLFILFTWIVVFLLLAFWRFKNKDI